MAKKISLSVLALVFALALAFGFAVIPAGKVSAAGAVIAETKAAEGAYNISTEDNDTKFVVSAKWGTTVNTNGGAQMKIAATESEISTVNFTIENTGGSDLKIAVVALNTNDGLGNGKNKFAVISATDCTASDIDSGYGAKLPAIATGTSKNVSVTFDGNIVKETSDGSFVYLDFSHYDGMPNNSAFTVSNISFGESSQEPDPEPAISEGDFYMEGAAIRFDLDTGLRFTALLKESAYVENAEYGIVIFPLDQMTGIDLSAFDKDADYISLIGQYASDYIAERKAKNPDFAYTMETEPVLRQGEGLYELKGTIAEIVYNNLGRKFFAVAYAKISEKTYYSEFSSNYGASVAQVAADIYGDEDNEEDEIAILNDIIVRNACRKSGITLEAYNAGVDGQFAITISDKEINVGQTATLSPAATLNGKAINATFTFESEDTSVATIEGSAVTGVKDGSTTLNVYADYYGIKFNTAITVNVSTAVIPTYQVSVTNGTGSGSYQAGELVTIVANNIENKRFTGWTATGVTLSNASASTTTFEMPAGAVTVTANYVDLYAVSVTDGSADKATAAAGETVTITANAPEAGKEFDGWTATGVTLANASASTTTFEMPANAVTLTAKYKDIATSDTETISAIQTFTNGGNWKSSERTDGNKTATFTSEGVPYGGGGQGAHWALVTVDGASGKNMITFTLSATSAGTVQVGVPTAINMYNTYNNNNLAVLDGVTYDGAAATKVSDKNLYNIPLTANTEYTVVITLKDTISTNSVNIAIWPWNVANWGGTLTVKDFTFTEPTAYSITMSSAASDLASVSDSSATAGKKITLTAKDSGKAVTGFSYESTAGNGEVTGNSFTMPAADVTITSVTVEENSGETITKFQSWENGLKVGGAESSDNYGDTSITATSTRSNGGGTGDALAIMVSNSSGKTTVTLTVKNACTGDNNSTINLRICAKDSWNKYDDHKIQTISSVSGTGVTKYDNDKYAKLSLSKGDEVTLTITFNNALSTHNLQFIAYADGTGFIGDLVISNISFS